MKTCWNPATRDFRTDVAACRDYIYPEAHYVRVWVENPPPPGASQPTWLVDDRPLIGSRLTFNPCAARPFCVEIRVPYVADNPRKLAVSVRLSDGGTVTLPQPIEVVDRLVVGLGDSYASGEGNPDKPARFTQNEKEIDFLPALLREDFPDAIRGTQQPQKDGGEDGQASWLDRRCHRSMYSYQFKTALQMALANPREAVTYVSYSCSGATTGQIINKRGRAREEIAWIAPQLDSLRKVLTRDGRITREIDYLLLSTGGNDVGFSKFVTYVVLSRKPLEVFKRLPRKGTDRERIVKSSEKKEFQKALLGQTGNYFDLHTALLNAPSQPRRVLRRRAASDESRRIRIKGCQPGGPCPRIVLTPYPNILKDQDDNLCRADKKEFENPFGEDKSGADETRAKRIKTLDDYVFSQLRDVQQDPWISSDTGPGWTVARSNVEAFAGHGFCAQTRQRPLTEAEIFELPRWKDLRWQPFDPTKYRPYASRTRWVRLPIDAKLTTDQMHVFLNRIRIDILLEDDIALIMHPTAEGLAATADATYKEIQNSAGPRR